MYITGSLIAVLWAVGAGNAQSVDRPHVFDAVSVKPVAAERGDDRAIVEPSRIHYPSIALKGLLMNAYGVKDFQILGPAWLETEQFRVDATMPSDTSRERLREMFQNLLMERFKLKFHRETKELPVYRLAVARNGPKIKESVVRVPSGGAVDDKRQLDSDADGFPVVPPAGGSGISSISLAGLGTRIRGLHASMQELVNELARRQMLGLTVRDDTGLKATYDFVLTFSRVGLNHLPGMVGSEPGRTSGAPSEAPASSLPDLFHAVQSQLGLTLELQKGPVEVIVIDHVEKEPTGN